MFHKHLADLVVPDPILLNISELPRGVDNYHIDVVLSERFRTLFRKLLGDFITLETSQKEIKQKNKQQKQDFQDSYADMMTVLINRIKYDLSREEIVLLQFAVYRYILETTRITLDEMIESLRSKLSETRSGTSGKALAIQDQVFWLSKHYNVILYAINRHFFVLLRQAETKSLRKCVASTLNPRTASSWTSSSTPSS
jgi:hypothetical protein